MKNNRKNRKLIYIRAKNWVRANEMTYYTELNEKEQIEFIVMIAWADKMDKFIKDMRRGMKLPADVKLSA